MNPLFILVLGAGVEIVGDNQLAVPSVNGKEPATLVSTSSVGQQAGIMNKQVLEIGAAKDTLPVVGAKISFNDVSQAQSGLGNDQRMSLGCLRD